MMVATCPQRNLLQLPKLNTLIPKCWRLKLLKRRTRLLKYTNLSKKTTRIGKAYLLMLGTIWPMIIPCPSTATWAHSRREVGKLPIIQDTWVQDQTTEVAANSVLLRQNHSLIFRLYGLQLTWTKSMLSVAFVKNPSPTPRSTLTQDSVNSREHNKSRSPSWMKKKSWTPLWQNSTKRYSNRSKASNVNY